MIIRTGIASTTHLDRHNERLAKSALDGMAKQIKQKLLPQLVEHDWDRQIGVVLYGEVFKLDDGEYALGFISGEYENDSDKETYKAGQPNVFWQAYQKDLNIAELRKVVAHRTVSRPAIQTPNNIADLLELHLDSTEVLPDGTVYKIKRFIAAKGDLSIEVYPHDHDHQPHFHVISKQRHINARFDIETLDLINMKYGKIPNKDVKKIQNFFKTNLWALEKLKNEHNRLKK